MSADFKQIARVKLNDRIRVVVLLREVDNYLPDGKIEVTPMEDFSDTTTRLVKLARLLRRLTQ